MAKVAPTAFNNGDSACPDVDLAAQRSDDTSAASPDSNLLGAKLFKTGSSDSDVEHIDDAVLNMLDEAVTEHLDDLSTAEDIVFPDLPEPVPAPPPESQSLVEHTDRQGRSSWRQGRAGLEPEFVKRTSVQVLSQISEKGNLRTIASVGKSIADCLFQRSDLEL